MEPIFRKQFFKEKFVEDPYFGEDSNSPHQCIITKPELATSHAKRKDGEDTHHKVRHKSKLTTKVEEKPIPQVIPPPTVELKSTKQCLTTITLPLDPQKPIDLEKLMAEDDLTFMPKQTVVPTEPQIEKKKKKKRSQITICLTNCRYDIVRKVASAFGMKEVSEDEDWNFYWTDMSVSVERAKEMKRFQRINHFPGMLEICRKDLLARNLNRMQKIYPKEYNFFPRTWCLPADFGDALNYSKSRKNKTFIIKPECGSQGRGIYLTKSLKEIKPTDKLICQVYLAKPYLVDGYKFDIRVYTLITSCDPLRIFVYNEGLVRFATSRYADPNVNNTTNVFMHLTNYAVNKHSRTFVHDSEAGSKRKISTLNKILASQGVNLDTLWQSIDQVIVKTVISAWPVLKHSYHACFPSHDTVHACFELLGFDILLDHRMHPFILEVNHSPSFHTDTELDRDVKECLLTDTLTMLNVRQCDKRRVLDEDRRRIRDRLLHGTNSARCTETPPDERDYEKSPWQQQIQWEETHLGDFRRVYPIGDQYASLFQQPSASIYTATVSSRARGDCTRAQKEEFQQSKAKAEAALLKPLQNKIKDGTDKTKQLGGPDETQEKTKIKKSLVKGDLKKKDGKKDKKDAKAKEAEEKKVPYVLCSFEPDQIVEKEERERVNLLAQRDFLIRSYGLLEQIYLVMKKTGTLRPEDERKYGSYGKLAVINSKKETRITQNTNNNSSIMNKRMQAKLGDPVNGLKSLSMLPLKCGEAVIYERPMSLFDIGKAKRTTRTHVARFAYNVWKMNSIL